ncbi:MAG: T9SS type A sorting domain-containing protein [Bacteroidia bacterium]|nr:T9SS type A sorting domain-containing protein [Bacteroidia bacterium]
MKKNCLWLILTSILIIEVTAIANSQTPASAKNGSNNLFANCTGQPSGGTATALQASICEGESTTISLSGYTTDTGITFQWKESSVPGGPYSNVTGGTGATSVSYTTPQLMSTTYYVCEVTCTFSSQSTLSTETEIVVNDPQLTGTVAGTRCGPGTVTLNASAPAGTTINWYPDLTSGLPLDSGSSFTTPFITSTTTFYAAPAMGYTTVKATVGYSNTVNYNFITSSAGWGLIFTAHVDCKFDSVAVYPTGTGTITVCIRDLSNNLLFTGPTVSVSDGGTPGQTKIFVPVGASLTPGNYKVGLLSYTGITNLGSQTTGTTMAYPFVSPLATITSGTQGSGPVAVVYYWFYDLSFSSVTGCEGVRTPVTATVTPSDPVTIQAGANALCLGQSTTLTAVSNNSNYTYQWSPSTGLSGSTGSSVTAQPTTTITYTVYGNDGTCGALDSITISVGPPSVSGVASISSDTSCSGNPVILMLSGSVGSIQWQSNTGSGWVNETGTGSDSASYTVNPTISTSYQAIVTSGGCASATSSVVSVHVVTITDPVTTDDTICEGDTAMLTATGTGVINWFTSSSGGTPVASGPTYSPVVTTTTTFYAQSAAGSTYHVGAPHAGIGAQNMSSSANYGLSFDVQAQSVIEKVTIEPAQTGSVIINLRQVQNGTILNTVTVPVTAFIQAQPTLGFIVNPGTGYRLELGAGSVSCYYNSSGATYPYITAGSPLSITGYLNPNPNTGAAYYYFYNWQVSQGCASNLIPATVTVNPAPPVPIITQNGNQLTSSSSVNNQWYQNGNQLPGATGQVYNATQPGSYTVVVTDPATGCSSESQPVVIVGIQEVDQTGGMLIRVYPNPSTGLILLTTTQPGSTISRISVQDLSGRVLNEQLLEGLHRTAQLELELPPSSGLYILEVQTGEQKTMVKVVKE